MDIMKSVAFTRVDAKGSDTWRDVQTCIYQLLQWKMEKKKDDSRFHDEFASSIKMTVTGTS